MADDQNLDLVTIIVQFKDESKVLDAILKAGAPGATYFYGRGTGVRQRLGILGRFIEAEKVVVMTAVPTDKTQAVVKAATEAARVHQPGKGFICVHKIQQTVGLF